jgi:hypothetical protein
MPRVGIKSTPHLKRLTLGVVRIKHVYPNNIIPITRNTGAKAPSGIPNVTPDALTARSFGMHDYQNSRMKNLFFYEFFYL